FSLTRAAIIARFGPLALIIGCTVAPTPTTSVTPETAALQSTTTAGRGTVITATDLHSVNATSTLDAVEQLHPEFLRPSTRATNRDVGPSVYVDRLYVGDVSWLAYIQLEEVRDITFLHPTEARFRFGSTCRCGGGIVYVQTNSQSSP